MTKVKDKKLLQLGLKAATGEEAAEADLIQHVCKKFHLITEREHVEALALVRASSEPETVETTTEPEPEPPQEAV